jgi:hypothetical protein
MRFTSSSLVAGFSERPTPRAAWNERFFCGGMLLAIGGWVALHPPPKAPNLPSVCRAQLKKEAAAMEIGPEKGFTVWVDTRSRCYYYVTSPVYGVTPGGRYLDLRAAKRQGYRPQIGR